MNLTRFFRPSNLLLISACFLPIGFANACDDHFGKCEVEDWRSYNSSNFQFIDGVATCDSGYIIIRLYDGSEEVQKFIGTARDFIDGHTFKAIAENVEKPESLSIKYSIEPE